MNQQLQNMDNFQQNSVKIRANVFLCGVCVCGKLNLQLQHPLSYLCSSYLASGQDIKDVALAYRVGIETARLAIHTTCRAIWARLKDEFMKVRSLYPA